MTDQSKLTRVALQLAKECLQECAQLQRELDTWKLRVDEAGERIEQLQRERDEARQAFNDIDLCQRGQAPCKYALTLISEALKDDK